MKFNLSENDLVKLEQLFEINYKNQLVGEFYQDLIDNYSDVSSPFDLNKTLYEMELDNDDYFKTLIKEYRINEIKLDNVNDYLDNPYYKEVKLNTNIFKLNNYSLEYKTIKKDQLFLIDDLYYDYKNNLREITRLGYFNKDYKYLNIIKDNEIWMSLHPHEINTMEHKLSYMYGSVLVLGLGLGYFPYMVGYYNDVKNDEVISITIVEKDKNMIKLFKKLMPSYFDLNYHIVEDDVFNYFKNNKINFNTCFVDLYHNAIDGLPIYLKMKKIEKSFENVEFYYWIEYTILAYLRRIVISIIQNEYENIQVDYLQNDEENAELINEIYLKIKDLQFNSYKQIEDLLLNNLVDTIIA